MANACIHLSYWLTHFQEIVLYHHSKTEQTITQFSEIFIFYILLNTLGKLIKKVISKRLQVYTIVSNFMHLCQLGGIKQCLITDAGVFITYLI